MKHLKFMVAVSILSICFSGFADTVLARKFLWNKNYFYNFYSVCPLPSQDVWAVGSNGMICRLNPETHEWDIQESALHGNLYGVSFVDANKGWICGQNGQIAHTLDGGKTWQVQNSGTKAHLFSLTFKNSKKGWAVGDFGTILHTADGGLNWHAQHEKADKIYNKIYFSDGDHGWIVGEFGTILSTRDGGLNWVEQKNPLGEKTLFGVYFKDRLNGWIAGMDGSILTTLDGGKTWTPIQSPLTENLMGIQVVGNSGWVIGLKGAFGMMGKGGWNDATPNVPTRAWLSDCVFVDEKIGWLAGSVGTLLHTVDGGRTWLPANRPGPK